MTPLEVKSLKSPGKIPFSLIGIASVNHFSESLIFISEVFEVNASCFSERL